MRSSPLVLRLRPALSVVLVAAAASFVACAAAPKTGPSEPAGASTAVPSAATSSPSAPAARPVGVFTFAEECGAQGAFTQLGIEADGTVTVDMNGFQVWFEGKGHLVERAGGWEVVLDERNPEVPLPRFDKGDVVVAFTVRADGALEARNPPGNCSTKLGTFFKAGKEPARRLVHKVTRCPAGKAANAVAGGCICDGSSAIQNPCKAGGGLPDLKGNACVHLCSEP